jgi:hypothetical protein
MFSRADNLTLPAKIRNAYRIRGDRVAKLAVVLLFLRHHGLFPVQFDEGLAFLGQTLQHRGRFPEFAVLLMKFSDAAVDLIQSRGIRIPHRTAAINAFRDRCEFWYATKSVHTRYPWKSV